MHALAPCASQHDVTRVVTAVEVARQVATADGGRGVGDEVAGSRAEKSAERAAGL